jgi:hypothetical protein
MAGASRASSVPSPRMSGEPNTPVPSGSRVALIVLVVLVVLSPWPFGSAHLRTTQAIALVSLATALGAFLWDGWRGQLQLPPRAILWPLLGLWALAVLQLIPIPEGLHRWIAPGSAAVWYPDVPAAAAVLGPGPHPISLYPDATRRWLAFSTGVIALALAAAPPLRDRRLLLRACTAVVGGAVLVAVYGFVARLVFGNKLYGVWSVPTVAPFGPFVNKNHFAGYVELAALLAVGLATGLADEARHGPGSLSWIESRRSKWVVVAWGAALVLVLAVPVSLSRGGVVSLSAGLLVLGGLHFWTRGPSRLSATAVVLSLAVALLASVALVLALPGEARSRILSLGGITSEQSGSYRIGIWHDTLRLVDSSPALGSGLGAYADALPRFKTTAGQLRIEHAENDHLEFLAEGGAVAMLLGAFALLPLVLLSLGTLRGDEDRFRRAVRIASVAGITTIYVHSAFDFNLRVPSNALSSALLFAVITARTLVSSRSWAGHALLATSVAICGVCSWTATEPPIGDLVRTSFAPLSSLRRQSVEREVIAHLRRRPAEARSWIALSWVSTISSSARHALGPWAVRLDPTNAAVREMSQRIARN